MARKDTHFKEGHKLSKGRPKGSPNRTTESMRQVIKQIIDNQLENLESDLAMMNPRNRWDIITKLTSYVMPTLSKNDNHNHNEGGISIKVEYVGATELDAPDTPINLANPTAQTMEIPPVQPDL